jgi:hypothetical protein
MQNTNFKKTENEMLAEMHALRASLIEAGKEVVGKWTQRIVMERAAA